MVRQTQSGHTHELTASCHVSDVDGDRDGTANNDAGTSHKVPQERRFDGKADLVAEQHEVTNLAKKGGVLHGAKSKRKAGWRVHLTHNSTSRQVLYSKRAHLLCELMVDCGGGDDPCERVVAHLKRKANGETVDEIMREVAHADREDSGHQPVQRSVFHRLVSKTMSHLRCELGECVMWVLFMVCTPT